MPPKTPIFGPAPQPSTRLGLHRTLAPTAAVKVSPICLGGISIGSSWSGTFGKNGEPFEILDEFFAMGGNFIDTSNIYHCEESERLIGEWMELRGNRDQMVIATKYSAGYKAYDRETIPLQTNYTGNSAKSMHVSFRDSLKKLRTDYVDLFYVHWWGFDTTVEEVMRGLHTLVMAQKVLYLGASDMPAWVVVKANAFARANGLTPFSVYQGQWNAAFRDIEAEIIPMCEDEGLSVVPWAALGGGALKSAEQRRQHEGNPDSRPSYPNDKAVQVSGVLEHIAEKYKSSLQSIALAYLRTQTPYVVPIVGVQNKAQVQAMEDHLAVRLSSEDVSQIHDASPMNAIFPMNFLFNYRGDQPYHAGLTGKDSQQYQMAARFDNPPKQTYD